MAKKLSISVGIMAYNEAQNIEKLLNSLLSQKLNTTQISEIIIVSSGSTDKTNKIVRSFAKQDSKIKLVIQKTRLGKSAAVNLFLKKAKEDLILLLSADLILEKDTVDLMATHFKKSSTGIVGAHPIPVNNPNTFFGFTAIYLWQLHHEISLKKPKMGEMILFRKIFQQIPLTSAVDEANIEPLIRGQGYKAVYAEKAIVHNKSPENLEEFIKVRRRVYSGHLAAKYEYSYEVSTFNNIKLLFLIIKTFKLEPKYFLFVPTIILLEGYSRLLGFLDYKFNLKNHTIWEVTSSTKNLS